MARPPIICLTPTKNEAWILERFLQAASLWADRIIVADQQSTDATRDIAVRFAKVTLIDNPEARFSEVSRQRLLISAARAISPQSLLIALDADEFLSANFQTSHEWRQVTTVPPGTVLKFRWANIRPDLRQYWLSPTEHAWGFMDDGREHTGREIHNTRVPAHPDAPIMVLRDVRVLHYQYADWARMKSKHRWYQCWEHARYPKKRAVDIYRLYHHMDHIPPRMLHPLPTEWTSGYLERGIDLCSFPPSDTYWWDYEVLRMFEQHGTQYFRKQAIWDFDWTAVARRVYGDTAPTISDPRSRFDKLMHRFLRATQPFARSLPMKILDKLFVLAGW